MEQESKRADDASGTGGHASSAHGKMRDLSRRISPSLCIVGVVFVLCATAIALRVPLRSLYWASRAIAAKTNEDFAAHITLLCQAGDAGRWGTARLLRHRDAAIRQAGVLVLHHGRGRWSRGELVKMLCDEDAETADLAAVGVALRRKEFSRDELLAMRRTANPCQIAGVLYAVGRSAVPGDEEFIAEIIEASRDIAVIAEGIDALESIATPAAAAVLLRLLDDSRNLAAVSRRNRIGARALGAAAPQATIGAADGILDANAPPGPGGRNAEPARESLTVGGAASRALGRISGLPAADDVHPTTEEVARWRGWIDPAHGR